MTDPNEAELVAHGVDRHDWGPTEPDEEQVLQRIYGQADADGIYRGQPRQAHP